jgi:hypothetical protein
MAIKEKCAICGGTKSLGDHLCANLCDWKLEGWVGWNARDGKLYFANAQAVKLWASYYMTYRKMVKIARSLGWKGQENSKETMKPVQTFTPAAERILARKWTGVSQFFFSTTAVQYREVV